MGEKGDLGSQGLKGDKGDMGAKGEDGLPGAKGDTGSQGLVGPKGIQGSQGVNGTQGLQGEKGDLGSKGDKGDTGVPGTDGLKGDKGEDGLPGVPGLEGEVGLKGAMGAPGDKGDSGPVGQKGDIGPKGIDGQSGPRGDQGFKGQIGRSGPQGNTGMPGPKGSKGEDGIGAADADQFLRKMNQTKLEIQNAQKAAEDAKSASEKSAKEAKGFKEEADNFADKAFQSEKNTEVLYSSTKDMFCKTSPAEQVCTARRKKREIEKLNNPPVTSGASRPSSWINVFANTIVGAITGAFQPVSSFKPAIGFNNSQPSKAITTQDIDINGTLSLLDVFIRKITGQKYISTTEQSASPSETLGYSSQIAEEFERVLKYAAVKSGISVKNLSFNPVSVQSAIFQHINNGQYSKIPKSLYSFAKGACPNYKQTDKFLAIFKDHMERALGSNEQPSNTKEIVTGSEQPRSFMSNVAPPSSLSAINHKAVGYLR